MARFQNCVWTMRLSRARDGAGQVSNSRRVEGNRCQGPADGEMDRDNARDDAVIRTDIAGWPSEVMAIPEGRVCP